MGKREEYLKQLQKPQKYIDICCFCGKRTGLIENGGGHTQEEMERCVMKKWIAQGLLPEDYEEL